MRLGTKYLLKRDGKEMSTLRVTKDVSGWDNLRKDWMEFGKRMATLSNARKPLHCFFNSSNRLLNASARLCWS